MSDLQPTFAEAAVLDPKALPRNTEAPSNAPGYYGHHWTYIHVHHFFQCDLRVFSAMGLIVET
jgi:hypothetical protein